MSSTAYGPDWLGAVIEREGPALFYTGEESDKELHRRLAAILAHYDLQYSDIVGRFFAHCRPADDPVLGAPDRNGIIQPTPSFPQLQEAVLDIRQNLYASRPRATYSVATRISAHKSAASWVCCAVV
jgi:hypothetical protein